MMSNSQNKAYNFIAVLKPNYREMTVHYSTDNKKWEQIPMMRFGPRYYASVAHKFREIRFFFQGITHDGEKFQDGSQTKPYQNLHISLMPSQQVHLLERNPDPEFIRNQDILAKYDLPVARINVDDRDVEYILNIYPDYLLAYTVWVKDRYKKGQFRACVEKADLAYQYLQNQEISILRQYPDIPRQWLREIFLMGEWASEKCDLPEYGVKFLEFGTEILPNDFQLRSYYADALKKAGHLERCYTAYLRSIELNPREAETFKSLCEAYLEGSELDFAKKSIKKFSNMLKSIRLPPHEKNRYLVDVQKCYGILEHKSGNPKKARKYFKQGQRMDPNNPFNNLAFARFEKSLGNRQQAQELGTRALMHHPERAKVMKFVQSL